MKNYYLNQIRMIRNQKPFSVYPNNDNRYTLLVQETSGSLTAYCFSTPIYQQNTGHLLQRCFTYENGRFMLIGSSAVITIAPNQITLQNQTSTVQLLFPDAIPQGDGQQLTFGNYLLTPGNNGLCITCIAPTPKVSLTLQLQQPFSRCQGNSKFFALLREENQPYFLLSLLGATNQAGTITAPGHLAYQKNHDKEYQVHLSASQNGRLQFELNFYEPRLWQDTTVESMNPQENNVYGSIAFLGQTHQFGEQWLYIRPDFSKLSPLPWHKLQRAVLYLPILGGTPAPLAAHRIARRFCSFGSQWNNKIPQTEFYSASVVQPPFQAIEVTDLLTSPSSFATDGLVLRQGIREKNFTAVATGDQQTHPPILELQFAK